MRSPHSPSVESTEDVLSLGEVERDYIAAALRASAINRVKPAENLGIRASTHPRLEQARP